MSDVQIVEVSPRDGLQNEKQLVSTEDKAALVRRALDAGARRIEVTAFAHPERVPQMADAEAVMAEVRDDPRLRSIGLVLNRRGLDRAIAAGCDEVDRRRGRLRRAGAEEPGRRHRRPGRRLAGDGRRRPLRRAGDDGDPGGVVRLPLRRRGLDRARAGGRPRACSTPAPTSSRSPTRSASAYPPRCARSSPVCARSTPTIPLRAHFHNTRNTGYANALAAIESGVTRARRVGRRHRRLPVRARRHRQHRHRGPDLPARALRHRDRHRPRRRWPPPAPGSASSSATRRRRPCSAAPAASLPSA